MERFNGIMLNILETLNDVSKSDETGTMLDSLVVVDGQNLSDFYDDTESYYETDHDLRKKQLVLLDPVHSIVLKDYFQAQVRY